MPLIFFHLYLLPCKIEDYGVIGVPFHKNIGRCQVADRRNDRIETSYELFNIESWTEKKVRYSDVRVQLDVETPARSAPTFRVVLL
jgi:hypothetical protein